MKSSAIETIVGFLVLSVALTFLFLHTPKKEQDTYNLYIAFDRADGIKIGSDVRVGGISIGNVSSQQLNQQTYKAIVGISIDKKIAIPSDTSAQIIGDGLLGGKYIALLPGADEEMLNEGGKIEYSQSSISIEALIGKFMFGNSESK